MKLLLVLALVAAPAFAEEFPAIKSRSETEGKELLWYPKRDQTMRGIQVKTVVHVARPLSHEFDETRHEFDELLKANGYALPPAPLDTEIRVMSIFGVPVFHPHVGSGEHSLKLNRIRLMRGD